jgi:predicted XRE-type DNA-binding protein
MMEVPEVVRRSGIAKAAVALGTTQPRLNDALKGKIEKCSVDRLAQMLAAVGYIVKLNICHAA